jgi:hypothetical protein
MSALVHRLNGGLNNASLALEIGVEGNDAEASRSVLRTGRAAVAQASRAATLLAHLVDSRWPPAEADALYAEDVREILAEHARSKGRALRSDFGVTPTASPAEATAALVAELARMERGG